MERISYESVKSTIIYDAQNIDNSLSVSVDYPRAQESPYENVEDDNISQCDDTGITYCKNMNYLNWDSFNIGWLAFPWFV